jgi:hypothetical protein
MRPAGSDGLSGCFELELLADELGCLSQDGGTETEGALDDLDLRLQAILGNSPSF